jgi:glycosyltransferase involved in cell wall biosynthesis
VPGASLSESFVDLAVIICTHNRAVDLARTLQSLRRVTTPLGSWELLVVDNASTDRTHQVVADEASEGILPIRLITAETLGLSHARNRALEVCAAEAMVFLDDDVDVEPLLLVAYERALQRHPTIGYFGGPIRPLLEDPDNPMAAAILDARPGAFSCVDLGQGEVALEPGRAPFGANMCVRSSMVRGLRFDTRFSYVGRGGIVGEETDFFFTLQGRGIQGRWVPDAVVFHRIPAARASWSFLERFARGDGVSLLRMEHKAGTLPRVTLRLALWYARRAVTAWLQAKRADRAAPLAERVDLWYRAWERLGAASEARRLFVGAG